MAFMVPEVEECEILILENRHGEGTCIPADAYDSSQFPEDEGWTIAERKEGWIYRLSAPGYMDCTEWSSADSEEEARAEIESMYDCCPYCGEGIEDSSELDETIQDPALCSGCDMLLPSSKGKRGVWYYARRGMEEEVVLHYYAPSDTRGEIVQSELQSLGGSHIEKGDCRFLYCIVSLDCFSEAETELRAAGFSVEESN